MNQLGRDVSHNCRATEAKSPLLWLWSCIPPEGGDSVSDIRHRQRYSVCVSRVSVNAWKSTLYIIPGIGCSSSVEGKIPCTVIFVTDQCRSQKTLHVDSGSSFLVQGVGMYCSGGRAKCIRYDTN